MAESSEDAGKKKLCFIIGPIGADGTETRDHADWVAYSVEKALIPRGYEVQRADKIKVPGLITDQVIDLIDNANVIIADLAELNPNAFYELGVVHAARKPVVHVFPAGQRLPFDIQEYRAVEYRLNNPHSLALFSGKVREQVLSLEEQQESPSNPVSRARGLRTLVATGDQKDQLLANIAAQLANLEARLNNFERPRLRKLLEHLEALDTPVKNEGSFNTNFFSNFFQGNEREVDPPWPATKHERPSLGDILGARMASEARKPE